MLMLSNAHASDAKKGAALAQGLCAACHASDGNSVIPSNPILGRATLQLPKKPTELFSGEGGRG